MVKQYGKAVFPEELIWIAMNALWDKNRLMKSFIRTDDMHDKTGFIDEAKYWMLKKAALKQSLLSELQFFNEPVSYNALKEANTKYVHNFKSIASNFSFEETRTSPNEAAVETIHNDFKEVESSLDNKWDLLSEHFQNLTLILLMKEAENQMIKQNACSYRRKPGHFANQCEEGLAKDLHEPCAAGCVVWKICIIRSSWWDRKRPSLQKKEMLPKQKEADTIIDEKMLTTPDTVVEEIERFLMMKLDADGNIVSKKTNDRLDHNYAALLHAQKRSRIGILRKIAGHIAWKAGHLFKHLNTFFQSINYVSSLYQHPLAKRFGKYLPVLLGMAKKN